MVQIYTPHDIALREQCVLILQDKEGERQQVRFQFPPLILSDSRKGSWSEDELRGPEPISNFETSGAREIALSWTYIVDGGEFTVRDVAEQVKLVRGYFAAVRSENNTRNLIVFFKYALFGDIDQEVSARMKSIDVKHSETIVSHIARVGLVDVPGGVTFGRPDTPRSYPLRTDITVELRIWTQGADKVQDLAGMTVDLPEEWY